MLPNIQSLNLKLLLFRRRLNSLKLVAFDLFSPSQEEGRIWHDCSLQCSKRLAPEIPKFKGWMPCLEDGTSPSTKMCYHFIETQRTRRRTYQMQSIARSPLMRKRKTAGPPWCHQTKDLVDSSKKWAPPPRRAPEKSILLYLDEEIRIINMEYLRNMIIEMRFQNGIDIDPDQMTY